MKLVVLYGPPGVGKLTVGTALADLTGFKLFHNHLSVDLVNSLFAFRSPPWLRLLRRIRDEAFAEAARTGLDVIFTRALRSESVDEIEAARIMFERAQEAAATILFVRLSCERNELLRRLRRDDRQARGKLTDPAILLAEYDLSATLPFEPHLHLDTTDLTPDQAAARIAAHFGLLAIAPPAG
jgi:chloramphenicol 3-O-phosphotransferase